MPDSKELSLFTDDELGPIEGKYLDGQSIFETPEIQAPLFDTFGDNYMWAFANMQAMWVMHNTYKAEKLNPGFRGMRAKYYHDLKNGKQKIGDLIGHHEAKREQDCCWYCNKPYRLDQLTRDHVFPRSKGGENVYDNIIYVCPQCNLSKGNKDLIEWFFVNRKEYPHYWLIFYYLKEVYMWASANNIMNSTFEEVMKMKLPFNPLSVLFFQNDYYMQEYLRKLHKI